MGWTTNKISQRCVAPLDHVMHIEGHVTSIKHEKSRVAPLEHVVHLEGHVAILIKLSQ